MKVLSKLLHTTQWAVIEFRKNSFEQLFFLNLRIFTKSAHSFTLLSDNQIHSKKLLNYEKEK